MEVGVVETALLVGLAELVEFPDGGMDFIRVSKGHAI